jgi:hypothetical protein
MKLLVAVLSCHKKNFHVGATHDWFDGIRQDINPAAQRQACRETWLRDSKADYKFFLGKSTNVQPMDDEVFLDCGDSYHDNGFKIHGMIKWALERGYTHMFRVDDDTMVWPQRLFMLPWWKHDYLGNSHPNGTSVDVHAGFAVFLSKRLMELVAERNPSVNDWADDVWVGQIAKKNGIITNPQPQIISRLGNRIKEDYYIDVKKLPMDHEFAALHSATPAIMRAIYEREHKC